MDKDIQVKYFFKDFEYILKLIPFISLPWEEKTRFSIYYLLKEKIKGIPCLIIFDKDGNLITSSGRGAIEKNPNCMERWLE